MFLFEFHSEFIFYAVFVVTNRLENQQSIVTKSISHIDKLNAALESESSEYAKALWNSPKISNFFSTSLMNKSIWQKRNIKMV